MARRARGIQRLVAANLDQHILRVHLGWVVVLIWPLELVALCDVDVSISRVKEVASLTVANGPPALVNFF
jgi:hypothetical protein